MAKVIVHPTGHVEVEVGSGMQMHPMTPGGHGPQGAMGNMHGHPAAMQPAPQPGINSQEGISPDPMAAGMNNAMNQALSSAGPQAKEPIQKTDAKRGGSEANDSKKMPDKSVGKKPAPQKSPMKGKPGNGKPPKATDKGEKK